MTSQVVADSGIYIATVLLETYTKEARQLISQWKQQNTDVYAPVLFKYEVVAAIRKHVHRGTLPVADGIRARDFLLAEPVNTLVTKH
jgi:predicted nucleic acid-binding protein